MNKKALITGITGQDGSYLAELLLSKGYRVVGMVRRSSTPNFNNIEHILNDVELVAGDMVDQASIFNIVKSFRPHEIYNLAAQSFVGASWKMPIVTGNITALGVTRILEAIRIIDKKIKFYQASSSEMFGGVHGVPQHEKTPFYPRSPYGVAKTYAHHITVNYRESYGIFACAGILFNHESPRRGIEFVTRKIANGVARISEGLDRKLVLGNLEAKRDWGFAGDYVKAMWLMLQQSLPDDYVVGTGKSYSVEEFVALAFKLVGIKNWRDYVEINQDFVRPAEVRNLVADPTKIREKLGWKPKYEFVDLVEMMVKEELVRIRNEKDLEPV